MKFQQIQLEQVLNYELFELDFGKANGGLHILYGPNETGKSTLLQVLIDILFGGKIGESNKNYYHSKSNLRAVLEAKNVRIFLERNRKRNKLELSNTDLMEDTLKELLGGFDREQYSLLFGFDHERLREGGKSLLVSEGHAGISLFETGGGLQFLQNFMKELENRSNELLDPGFRAKSAKVINRLWQKYKETEKTMLSSSLRGDKWKRLKMDLEETEQELERLHQERTERKGELKTLERIQRVRTLVGSLQNIKAELATYREGDIFSEEMDHYILKLMDHLKDGKSKLRDIQNQYESKVQKLHLIRRDPMVLKFEREINLLNEGLQQYRSRKWEEIPEDRKNLERQRWECEQLITELHPGTKLSDAETYRIPYGDMERIEQLSKEIEQLEPELELFRNHLQETKNDIDQAKEKLREIGEPENLSELETVVKEVREQGDLEDKIKVQERKVREKRADLERRLSIQTLWKRDLEPLRTTPIPIPETRERFLKEWTEYEKEIKEAEKKLEHLQSELNDVEHKLKVLEAQGPVPLVEDLFKIRTHRDFGWEIIKNAWTNGKLNEEEKIRFAGDRSLPEAYEESVRKADEISDLLRIESNRSAERAHNLLQREKILKERNDWERIFEEKKGRLVQLQEDWHKEWQASGIEPKSPSEMKEWLTLFYYPMLESLEEMSMLEQELEELILLKETCIKQLKNSLLSRGIFQEEELESLSLKSLLTKAEETLKFYENKKTEYGITKKSFEEAERKLALQEKKLMEISRSLEEKMKEWKLIRTRYPALPSNIKIAVIYIEKLKQLFLGLSEIGRIEKRIEEKEAQCRSFEQEILHLAQKLGEKISDSYPEEEFIRATRQRLDRAKNAEKEYEMIEEDVVRLKETMDNLGSEVANLDEEIKGYINEYGCQNEDGLIRKVERSRKGKELEKEKVELENRLFEIGDSLPIRQLEGEVLEADDQEVVAEKIRQLEMMIQDLEKRAVEKQEQLFKLRHDFEQMDGTQSEAAEKAQEMEEYLAEIDFHWEEYLRIEMAKRLLQRAIEQFREENESTVIERAGSFFHKLTLGKYEGLAIEYEDHEPYIEAQMANGIRKKISELSDGTRDQLFLALRLAFIEQQIHPSEPIPLIMDDVLVNFDDERTMAALEVLNEIGEHTQILYFTHHKSILELASHLPKGSQVFIHDLEKRKMESLTHVANP